MSGSRDTRESAEEVGAAAPADAVPPSFGGAAPPADPPPADARPEPAEEAEPAASDASDALRLPPFGLQAPWWAAESTETGPPEEDGPSRASAAEDLNDGASGDDSGGEPPAPSAADTVPIGTLVAGVGVPNVDSRGAVPATPLVKRPLMSGDTDPDGFAAVRPDDERPEDASGGAEPAAADAGESGQAEADDDTAVDIPAATAGTGADTDTRAETATDGETRTDGETGPTDETDPAGADTVVDMPAVGDTARERPEDDEQASAFERAKAAEDATGAAAGPVLEPDAILPVGVTPPTGSGPFPNTGADEAVTAPQAAVMAPGHHAGGGAPAGQAPGTATGGVAGTKRRLAFIGTGAAVILAAGTALFAFGAGGSDAERAGGAKAAEPPASSQPAAPAPTPSSAHKPPPSGPPSRIDHERTDPRPLAFQDVFPTTTIKIGGRTYTRDRWSLNRDPSYAARGSMLQTLQQQKCRKIIRATFIDRSTSLAVTSGIAVMPTKEAALKVSQAGDPVSYQWFRGMGGKHTPNLDRAGGYAATTVRGRYVAYAYVQWANGNPARPGDPVIKQAAKRFLDYDLRPIVQRARG